MESIKIFLVTLVCLSGIQFSANAQTPPELINNAEFRPVARQAVDSLYNANPQAAHQLLEPWKQQYPGHPLWTLFDGMELWWQILGDLEDTSHDEKFFDLMGRADYQAGRLLSNQPDHADALLIKAISNGYIARQHANRGRWLKSMNQARKAYKAYQYLQELQPGLPDLKLAEGLKLYYAAHLPEEYPIVKTVSWFLPDGDKQKGLQYLREAARQSIFARAEARYFLGNINLNYEEDYREATRHLEMLYGTYPNNSYYARILARSYYRMHRFDEALIHIRNCLERWQQNELDNQQVLREELLTWKGRIYYRRFQYREAASALQQAFAAGKKLPRPKERSQHVIAGYYLGRSYLQLNNKQQAQRYLEAVSDMDTQKSYRKHAEKLLDEQF